MKAVVAAFNQEKALVGAFSVLTNIRMELFQALGQEQLWAALGTNASLEKGDGQLDSVAGADGDSVNLKRM